MSRRLSEIEYTLERVPYLLGKNYIGGYLGPPELLGKNEEYVFPRVQDVRLVSIPRLAATNKAMKRVAHDHYPKFGKFLVGNNYDDIPLFAYDNNTRVADVFEDILSRPDPNSAWYGLPNGTYAQTSMLELQDPGDEVVPRPRKKAPDFYFRNENTGTTVDRGLKIKDLVAQPMPKQRHGLVELRLWERD